MTPSQEKRPACTCGIEWVLSQRASRMTTTAIQNPVTVAPNDHAKLCPVRLWEKGRTQKPESILFDWPFPENDIRTSQGRKLDR